MTLEQYAYLAEIIGVILVIASLIYVAQQLRHNTEVTLTESANSFVQLTLRMGGDIVSSREVAEYWVKAADDFEGLDEVDKTRAIMFEYRAIQAWSHFFRLREKGLMPDAQWTEIVWFIENLGAHRQSVREAWKVFKGGYPEAFQNFLRPYLEKTE